MTILNDSYVHVSDIAEGNGGLLCHTNRSDCCRKEDGSAQGFWYFPNPPGDPVPIRGERTTGDFFYRDRDDRIVRLNRIGNPSERGRFCCEIPNAAGDTVTLYVNIGKAYLLLYILPIPG